MYRNSPVEWAKYRKLNIYWWSKYQQALESLVTYPITCIKSGHGVGKTDLAALAVNWWLDIYDICIALTTSASWGSLSSILNPRIREKMLEAGMYTDIQPNDNGIEINPHKMWISKSTKISENLQGAHSQNILQVIDESSGIEFSTQKGINANSTGENSRQLWIGNPIRTSGPFYDLCTSGRSDVNVITISSLEHPNVVLGRTVVGGGAVTRADIEKDIKDFDCRECPENTPGGIYIWWIDKWIMPTADFSSRVLGEFPSSSAESMISKAALNAASKRAPKSLVPTVLGVDVARSEQGDETVFALGNRFAVLSLECHRGYSITETAGRIKQLRDQYNLIMVGVDDMGVGGGVTDRLRELEVETMPVVFSESALEDERFINLKAEIHWHFKQRVETDAEYSIPNDEKFIKQCAEIRKTQASDGRIQIEGKDKYKKRTGESPDRAEAAIIMNHVARMADFESENDPLNIYVADEPSSGNEGFNPWGGGEDDSGPKGREYYERMFR